MMYIYNTYIYIIHLYDCIECVYIYTSVAKETSYVYFFWQAQIYLPWILLWVVGGLKDIGWETESTTKFRMPKNSKFIGKNDSGFKSTTDHKWTTFKKQKGRKGLFGPGFLTYDMSCSLFFLGYIKSQKIREFRSISKLCISQRSATDQAKFCDLHGWV